MKLAPLIMILIILQAVIIFYDQVYADAICEGDCVDEYELTAYSDNQSAIWNFVANPTDWRGTGLLTFLMTILAASAVATFVGAIVGYKGDMILFFGTFTFFLTLGAVPIISLYNVITRDSSFYGCAATGVCYPSLFVWVFTGGILSIFYVLAVLDWWRTGSTG